MVVIEDLISTGGSVLEACEAAAREGANVLGVAAIFTYELPQGLNNFEKAQLPLVTLTNYSTMIDTALEMDYIGKEDIALLQQWKQSPQTWTGK
ncbi:Orotate phosphoribosyltransferase [Enterococcus sp. HSIEG1]|nr:Orotate phosphoribosyltransferase [Enterococcus sp. HSIEG1]